MEGSGERPVPARRGGLVRATPFPARLEIVVALFLGSPLLAHCQALAVEARPNPAPVGSSVTLAVTFDCADVSSVSAELPPLPESIELEEGPDIRPYVDLRDPSRAEARVAYTVSPTEPGRFAMPGITIRSGAHSARTVPFILSVGYPTRGAITIPLVARWKVPRGPLFAGETFPAVLEVVSEPSAIPIDGIRLVPPSGLFVAASGVASTSFLAVGKSRLYTVPAGVFEVTPAASGPLTLPAASVLSRRRTGRAEPRTVTILADPSGIESSGAVGAYAFRSWAEIAEGADGSEVTVHERVDGTGNLSFLRFQDPVASGLSSLGSDELSSYRASLDGYTGFREKRYRYLLASASGARVSVAPFSWLDPATGRVGTEAGGVVTWGANGEIQVRGAIGLVSVPHGAEGGSRPPVSATGGGESGGRSPTRSVPFAMEPWRSVSGFSYHAYYLHPLAYLSLLPGPLVFLLLLLSPGRRRKASLVALLLALWPLLGASSPDSKRIEPLVREALADYDAGRYDLSSSLLARALAVEPENAPLAYDRALAAYRGKRYGEAVWAARAAVFYAPLDGRYRSFLEWMTGRMKLVEQVPTVSRVHPDLFFLALALFVNLSGLAAALVMLRRNGAHVILLVLSLALAAGSSIGLLAAAVERDARTGVVARDDTEMRKIPVDAATRWLTLPGGMAVGIVGESGGYCLVETGYGIEGWVRTEDLLLAGGAEKSGIIGGNPP